MNYLSFSESLRSKIEDKISIRLSASIEKTISPIFETLSLFSEKLPMNLSENLSIGNKRIIVSDFIVSTIEKVEMPKDMIKVVSSGDDVRSQFFEKFLTRYHQPYDKKNYPELFSRFQKDSELACEVGQTEEQNLEVKISETLIELETVSNNSPEEIIFEERRIDGRVNNGRIAEDHLSDCIPDKTVWKLMVECHESIFGFSIKVTNKLKMYLSAFAKAFYKLHASRFETVDGKLAHLHRLVESHLGSMVGCGLRALQKGLAWLRGDEIGSISENRVWLNKAEEKKQMWIEIEEKIISFLCNHELLQGVLAPH